MLLINTLAGTREHAAKNTDRQLASDHKKTRSKEHRSAAHVRYEKKKETHPNIPLEVENDTEKRARRAV